MSNGNQYVNLSYVPKEERNNLKYLISNWVEKQKNYTRLNTIVVNECGKRCLSNFKSDNLNNQETICLTNCIGKYYDVLELGENIYDKLSTNQIDLTPLTKGDFDTVLAKL